MTTKSLFAMLGILLLGFAIGFLTAGHFTKRHIKHIHKIKTAEGFQNQFLNIVDLDDAQQEKLLPLLQDYGTQFQQIHIDFKKQRVQLIEALQKKVNAELDEAQQESAKKFFKRLKRPRRFKKKKHKQKTVPE